MERGGGIGLISLPPSPVRRHVLQNDALPSSSGSLDTHSVSTRMEEEEGEVMEERRRPMGEKGGVADGTNPGARSGGGDSGRSCRCT